MADILAMEEILNVCMSSRHNFRSKMLYQCTKFHAFITHSTIFPYICRSVMIENEKKKCFRLYRFFIFF